MGFEPRSLGSVAQSLTTQATSSKSNKLTSGFRSRWTTPCRCKKSTTLVSFRTSRAASVSVKRFFRRIRSRSSPPRRNSVTMYVCTSSWRWKKSCSLKFSSENASLKNHFFKSWTNFHRILVFLYSFSTEDAGQSPMSSSKKAPGGIQTHDV